MNKSASTITPTPEGAALVMQLGMIYGTDIPLTNVELGQIYLRPRAEWNPGLAEKLEALLNPPPPPRS